MKSAFDWKQEPTEELTWAQKMSVHKKVSMVSSRRVTREQEAGKALGTIRGLSKKDGLEPLKFHVYQKAKAATKKEEKE